MRAILRWRLFSWVDADTRPIEVLSAYSAMVWAGLLTGVDGRASTIYSVMLEIMPLWAWIALFGGIGVVQAIGVCALIKPIRRLAAFVAWGLWALIAILYALQGISLVSCGLQGLISLACAWVCLQGPSSHGRINS